MARLHFHLHYWANFRLFRLRTIWSLSLWHCVRFRRQQRWLDAAEFHDEHNRNSRAEHRLGGGRYLYRSDECCWTELHAQSDSVVEHRQRGKGFSPEWK